MKIKNKILAFCLSVLMIAMSCAGILAQNGGGIIENKNYTIGVDLSIFNIGGSKVMDYDSVDFAKMKADGCDFAILRIGFEGSKTRVDTLDLAFLEYYKRAREAGMKLGIYFYALGTTYAEAVDDAQWVISVIEENDMYFEFPIYYDVEDDAHYALSDDQLTNLCMGWCETLEEAGYYGGIYGRDTILNKLTPDFRSRYDLWIRHIKSASGEQYDPAELNMSESASLWQYTMLQSFDGCTVQYTENQLDGNICYKDYMSIMYENGYNNCGERTDKNIAYKKDVVVFDSDSAKFAPSLTDGAAIVISPENSESWISVDRETKVVVDLFGTYDIGSIGVHSYDEVSFTAVAKSDDGETLLSDSVSEGRWNFVDGGCTARYIEFSFDGEAFIDEISVDGWLAADTTNLALGADYEAPSKIRGYTADLNDGNASTTFAPGTAAWYGLFCNSQASDENCKTGSEVIIFDLGRDYALSKIVVNVGSNADVKKPEAVKARFATEAEGKNASRDGAIYYLTPDSDSAVYTASTDVDGACARYVAIEINVYLKGNYWACLNEIEIYGAEFALDGKLEIPAEAEYILGDVDGDGDIDADDYILLKRIFFGTARLEDQRNPETAFLRADVDCDGEITADDYILLKRVYFGTATL